MPSSILPRVALTCEPQCGQCIGDSSSCYECAQGYIFTVTGITNNYDTGDVHAPISEIHEEMKNIYFPSIVFARLGTAWGFWGPSSLLNTAYLSKP